MVEPLDPQDFFYLDNPWFKRIGIWRNEVNTSSIYCVCSALSRQSKSSGLHESFSTTLTKSAGNLLKGVGKLAKTLNQLLWEDDTFPSPSPEPRPVRRSSLRQRIVYPVCPECGFPIDGVVYKRIYNTEFGLMRERGDSPESVCEARSLDETGAKRKALLRKISQVFRRTKTVDKPRTPSELADLSDIANGTQHALIPKVGSHKRDSGKKMGTEMYSDAVRPEAADDDGEGGPVITISDDSNKKPKVGIAESAARLRRAQKLLDKGP